MNGTDIRFYAKCRTCMFIWPGRETKEEAEADAAGAPALIRGSHWHKIMEIHYGMIQAESGTMERRSAIAEYLLDYKMADPDAADLLAWMYDGYEDMWGTDPDWEIVSIEDARLCRLPYPSGRPSPYWLRMRVDLIVRERFVLVAGKKVSANKIASPPKLWLVDHKTGKDLPKDKELDIDDQFGLYTWGQRSIGEPVFGSIHSAARTYQHKTGERPVDERFQRTRLYRTDRELQTIAVEAMVTARTAYSYAPGEAPRAPDNDRCRWRCPFTEACLIGRKTGPEQEQQFLESAGYEQIDEMEALRRRGYTDPQVPEVIPS
jgi:hypothetical protein